MGRVLSVLFALMGTVGVLAMFVVFINASEPVKLTDIQISELNKTENECVLTALRTREARPDKYVLEKARKKCEDEWRLLIDEQAD